MHFGRRQVAGDDVRDECLLVQVGVILATRLEEHLAEFLKWWLDVTVDLKKGKVRMSLLVTVSPQREKDAGPT
jgi:hypothetical protein